MATRNVLLCPNDGGESGSGVETGTSMIKSYVHGLTGSDVSIMCKPAA